MGILTKTKNDLEWAGMLNLDGHFGNPIPPGRILVPGEITLDESAGALYWKLLPTEPAETKYIQPPDTLIELFVGLFDARAPKIHAFAAKYGVLGLDDEGRFPREPNLISGVEAIETWRVLASRVLSVLHLAAMLQDDKNIGPEIIAGDPPPMCPAHHIDMAPTWASMKVEYVCRSPECSVVQAFTGYGPISTWAADEMNDSRHVCFDGSRLTALEGEHQPAHAEREYFWRQRPRESPENRGRSPGSCPQRIVACEPL